MPWGAAAAAIGGSLVSGMMGKKSAKTAADAQRAAAEMTIAEQRRQFDLTRQDTAPYREVGRDALYSLRDFVGLGSQNSSISATEDDLRRAQTAYDKFLENYTGSGSRDYAYRWNRVEADGAGQQRGWVGVDHAGRPTNDPEQITEYLYNDGIGLQRVAPGQMPGGGGSNAERESLMQAINAAQQRMDQARTASGADPMASIQAKLEATPGYKFRLGEGQKQLDRFQTAKRITGGRAVKEAMRYGQNYASGEYDKHTGRLFTLAGFGPAGVNTAASAGANAANNIGAANMAAGAGIANAAIAGGQAVNNAVQGGIGNYMTMKMYNDMLGRIPAGATSNTGNLGASIMTGGA